MYKSNSRGVIRTQSHVYDGAFLQKEAVTNFFKNALSQTLDLVLNTPLSSERLLQECEYMTNSTKKNIVFLKGLVSTTGNDFHQKQRLSGKKN